MCQRMPPGVLRGLSIPGFLIVLLPVVVGCGSSSPTPGLVKLPPPRIQSVAFSPDGALLAAGVENKVKLWELSTGQARTVLDGGESQVLCLHFSPDGKQLAAGQFDGTIRVWDLATAKELNQLKGHKTAAMAVVFAPDGKGLYSSGGDPSAMRPFAELKHWDLATGQLQTDLAGHGSAVWDLALAPEKALLVSVSQDGTLRVWDLTGKAKPLSVKAPGALTSVAFSPDGQTLAAGEASQMIHLWDTATWKERISLPGHADRVTGLAFSPSGKLLASVSPDMKLMLWDVASGKLQATLTGHTLPVTAVAFGPTDEVVATASMDGTVKLWDLAAGKERQSLQ